MERLILGTAGHIDHGKTTLVRALTGVDTDRLPEEKRRGITIDLGFAALDLPGDTRFGIVDVPGHEAFVRNMLAGASGVDIALLVVAADEGVMPQTREHLAILELLDVRALVVALTKADTVDDEWRELVTDDVRTLLTGRCWPDAPVVPVSGVTGAGLDALRDALTLAARRVRVRQRNDLFRMPIDRVFTVHGTGTVATGTVWSGTTRRDDQLRVVPGERAVRIRAVQSHGRAAAEAGAGERAALAIAGVERTGLLRGDTLVTGAGWSAASILTVRIHVLTDTARAIRPGQRVRVHLGTAEVMGRVTLMGRRSVEPGESGWAQLRLERPLVARARDRIVLRSSSPVTTIAGAVVAEPAAPRRGRLAPATERHLATIIEGSAGDAITACAALAAWTGAVASHLSIGSGLPPDLVDATIAATSAVVRTSTRVFDAHILEQAVERLAAAVNAWHESAPLEPGCDRDTLRRALPADTHPELLLAAIDRLVGDGRLRANGTVYAVSDWEPRISAAHAALIEIIRESIREAGLAAPLQSELPPAVSGHGDSAAMLRLLERRGEILAIEPGRYVSAAALADAVTRARDAVGGRDDLGPGDFRELWGVTRKHLIPLLEYLDRTGVTERRGQTRRLL